MGYERFVALGDSCTVGLDDRYPDGSEYRGWADLVATTLAAEEPSLRYANLGVRGSGLARIADTQVPAAARLGPDLVALFGGGNDVLARSFDAELVADLVDQLVAALTAIAPTVAVFTLSDFSQRTRLSGKLLGRSASRIEVLNAAIRRSARVHGALVVELWTDQAASDLRYFGQDRLHLSEHGHRRLAAHLLKRLNLPFDRPWLEPLPGPGEPGGPRAWLDDLGWVCREVLPVPARRVRDRMNGRHIGYSLPKRPHLLPVRPAGES
jgi:lysophospholipase L1-like esterase